MLRVAHADLRACGHRPRGLQATAGFPVGVQLWFAQHVLKKSTSGPLLAHFILLKYIYIYIFK